MIKSFLLYITLDSIVYSQIFFCFIFFSLFKKKISNKDLDSVYKTIIVVNSVYLFGVAPIQYFATNHFLQKYLYIDYCLFLLVVLIFIYRTGRKYNNEYIKNSNELKKTFFSYNPPVDIHIPLIKGRKHALSLFSSKSVNVPFLIEHPIWGIVIPEDNYSSEEIQFIIDHEFIHYKKRDIPFRILLYFAKSFFAWNILLPDIIQRFLEIMELSCDDAVLENKSRNQSLSYAKLLVKYQDSTFVFQNIVALHQQDETLLEKRLKNILDNKDIKSRPALYFNAFIASLISLMISVCHMSAFIWFCNCLF